MRKGHSLSVLLIAFFLVIFVPSIQAGPFPTYAWHTFYGSNGSDSGLGIVRDGSGNLYITGESNATWNGPAGQSPLNAHSGLNDIFVLKLNSSGAYQWHTFYGSNGSDSGLGIVTDGSGNVYITGESNAIWNGPAGQSPLNAHSGLNDIFALKLNSSGAYQWHTFHGSNGSDSGLGIVTDGSGNVYVTGVSNATWNGPAGQSPLNAHSGLNDIVVLKLAAPIPELLPDLIEMTVSDPPINSMPGGSFSVTDAVKNQGSASAGASITSYYLSLDTIKGSGDILLTGSRSVPSLGINETNDGILTVTIPSGTAAGSYFLLACADNTNLVEENNENNNCIASASKVSVGPVVSVTATDPAATEGGDTGTFRITRTGATTSGLSVRFAMSGSARNGVDYNSIKSPVTIPAGAAYVDITLSPVNDSTYEGDESAVLTLSANAAYIIGSPSSATITIQDNDPRPSFSVTSPNGGETWAAGSTQAIQWSYSGNPGSFVRIELLKGGVVTKVISNLARIGSGGSGSYNWAIPTTQVAGGDYRIKVASASNGAYSDTSDGNFTIAGPPPPTISVTSPNGGETLTAGSTQTIQWSYTGNPGSYVKIELFKGGVVTKVISNLARIGTGGIGSYNWSIPSTQAVGGDYQIKVTSTSIATYTDTSDGNFTIVAPSLTLTSPNGGETWAPGSTQTISWTFAGGPGTYLKIELLKGGILNRTITNLAMTSRGSFNWRIPALQVPGADYSIRIISRTNPSWTDTSDLDFMIGP